MASSILQAVGRWFGWGGALGENPGQQNGLPAASLIEGTRTIAADGALQISAVWACIDRRATTVASLPFFTYKESSGRKDLARTQRLYALLHDSPNPRMTPFEFWRAMMMNHDLRGQAFARVDRDPDTGEALALWPMPSDQVRVIVLDDGSMVYEYLLAGKTFILSADNVLHLKNLGNGTVGLEKLSFMASTTDEVAKAQSAASKTFANSGKPTAVLMVDAPLTPVQRESLRSNYGELATGNTARLAVLEANMKYQQLSLSPEDQQILETRNFGVEEICRWFDVPPVMVHHANVTTWGSGIEQIMDGWYKLAVRPMLVNIEQAVTKRVLTSGQRARYTVEFSLDALLRGNIKDRYEVYAKGVQNGLLTRNEARQLENNPPIAGGDGLTAPANLLPLNLLGKVKPAASGANGDNVAQ